jgi:hypothetical protein
MTTTAAAPSLRAQQLPAVTVPSAMAFSARPIGVRAAATMTAAGMKTPSY